LRCAGFSCEGLSLLPGCLRAVTSRKQPPMELWGPSESYLETTIARMGWA